MKYTYISLLFVAVTTVFGSCTDKLDMLPDNRMTLKSPSDVSRLLVSASHGHTLRAYLNRIQTTQTN